MLPRVTRCTRLLAAAVILLALTACRQGSSELRGWRAVNPGVDLSVEKDPGPEDQEVLALLYTIATGQDDVIERAMPGDGWQGIPALRLWAKTTRVLHLAVVLVDEQGQEHESARTLNPGDWKILDFDGFDPPLEDWEQVAVIRFVDRTGGLGGQGPVSLKLSGLPLDAPAP